MCLLIREQLLQSLVEKSREADNKNARQQYPSGIFISSIQRIYISFPSFFADSIQAGTTVSFQRSLSA